MKGLIIYDVDGTLIKGSMQDYGFTRSVGYDTPEEFWCEVEESFDKGFHANRVVCYMSVMLHAIRRSGIVADRNYFKVLGSKLPFLPGVDSWVKNLKKDIHGKPIFHYAITSGLECILSGSKLQDYLGGFNSMLTASDFTFRKGSEEVKCIWSAITPEVKLQKVSTALRWDVDPKKVIYIGDGFYGSGSYVGGAEA